MVFHKQSNENLFMHEKIVIENAMDRSNSYTEKPFRKQLYMIKDTSDGLLVLKK